MWIAGIIPLAVLSGIILFLSIPYSPTVARFRRIAENQIRAAGKTADLITEQDISRLPAPVQKYFRYCGYLGAPKMAYMRAVLNGVDFVMSESRTIKINYQQINLAERPDRFALISSSVSGLPFEGLDSFENGKGRMEGKLAKVIPLFDQKGENMDRSCLVTWLAECMLVPSAALQDFVRWEAVDDTHAAAVISWKGISARGTFTFSETGELLSFRTKDRVAVDMDGRETKADWSAYYRDYHSAGGFMQPRVIQSVWHYENGDCVYFNRNETAVEIRYR